VVSQWPVVSRSPISRDQRRIKIAIEIFGGGRIDKATGQEKERIVVRRSLIWPQQRGRAPIFLILVDALAD
jgi:hypothetical protein